jgi:hypothetical protein
MVKVKQWLNRPVNNTQSFHDNEGYIIMHGVKGAHSNSASSKETNAVNFLLANVSSPG